MTSARSHGRCPCSATGGPCWCCARRSAASAGILERRPYTSEQRTRHEYRLTAKGLDLYPVLMALRTWGDRYMAPDGPFVVYRHHDCRGVAEIQHVCSECGQALSARDVTPEAGPGTAAAVYRAQG
jgi:hypothetical protein